MQWASRPGASRFFGITNNQCCRIMLPLDFPCELLQVTKSAPWQHNSASSYAVAYGVFGSEKERKPRHTPRSFRPWRTFLNPSMPASCASQKPGRPASSAPTETLPSSNVVPFRAQPSSATIASHSDMEEVDPDSETRGKRASCRIH